MWILGTALLSSGLTASASTCGTILWVPGIIVHFIRRGSQTPGTLEKGHVDESSVLCVFDFRWCSGARDRYMCFLHLEVGKTLPFPYTSMQPDCIRETLGSVANRLQHLPILAFNRQLKPQARQPQQGTMST